MQLGRETRLGTKFNDKIIERNPPIHVINSLCDLTEELNNCVPMVANTKQSKGCPPAKYCSQKSVTMTQ